MSGGCISLADAGAYCGRRGSPASSARWARGHLLPNVRYVHLPGSGIVFRKENIDSYLSRFIVEPPDIDKIVAGVFDSLSVRRKG